MPFRPHVRAVACAAVAAVPAFGVAVALAASTPEPTTGTPPRAAGATAAAPAGDAQRAFRALLDEQWAADLANDPLAATAAGDSRYDDRLPVATPAEFERIAREDAAFLTRLRAIDRSVLPPTDRLNHELLSFILEHRVALAPFRAWRSPMLSDDGFHVEVMRMADGVPMNTAADYEKYVARLRAIPEYFRQNVGNMRLGMKEGYTLPAEILPGIGAVIDGAQFPSAEQSPFWMPFRSMPEAMPAAEQERLRAAARDAIERGVLPAYRELRTFFVSEYAPAARQTVGASALPEGARQYEALTRYFTNLDVTPAQVHEIGLREVARIRAEMDAVMKAVEFEGDFPAFLQFLRTDPQFYAKSSTELLMRASFIAKNVDGKLPAYFGHLPRMPYSVEPVPAELAPNYTAGRYSPPPVGGRRGGQYWVNTYALDKRPLYVLPALTLHEAVPGHHLQGAIAQELGEVPPFRRNFYPHAFGEGWGLYAEKLGKEMGVYTTPYEEFGRLTYEMWRAVRLVVDTGLHAKGWSRQQARDYLASHTALSLHEVQTEVDRYIAWPGQALAYKMGELKILELRARAERELGPAFDLRAFHDAVLMNGGVPLPVLERQVGEYLAAAKSSKAAAAVSAPGTAAPAAAAAR
jgi:uncharacterized protein (DUF885 family)